MYRKLILGSPGTGKTTRLLSITEDKLAHTAPENIAFFSFTKKAVEEATMRAAHKFNLPLKRLNNFKTLHGMAYRELGLAPYKVLNYSHLQKIGQITGLRIRGSSLNEEAMPEKGDKFLFLEGYARSIKRTYRDVWEEGLLDVSWHELKLFIDTYNAYKKENGLIDFTDMLEQYLIKGRPLNTEIAIIDEAQDLNPLQWEVVKFATQNNKELYIAGDDDQAIYRWSGADVEQFLSLSVNDKEVLPKSYRLPRDVYNFANSIVMRINKRYDKNWQPTNKEGHVTFHSSLENIDFEGEWLILARSNYQLKPIQELLRDRGLLFTFKNNSSIKEEHLEMILAYMALQQDKPIKAALNDIKKYYKKNLEWYEALITISYYDREYYRSVLRNGFKLTENPRIHVNTIHGSKGGEADNVLLITDLASQVYDNFMINNDDEHRVFYVGATRAKKDLHILTPQTGLYYEFI